MWGVTLNTIDFLSTFDIHIETKLINDKKQKAMKKTLVLISMVFLIFVNSLYSQEEISLNDWWETTVRFYEIVDSVPQYQEELNELEERLLKGETDDMLSLEIDSFKNDLEKKVEEMKDLKKVLVTTENIIGDVFLEQSNGESILFQNFVTEYSDEIGNEVVSDYKCENALIVHHTSEDWDLFTIFIPGKISVKKDSYIKFGKYDFYLFSNYYNEVDNLSGFIFKLKNE